jgi:hypothetical protein
MAPEGWKIGTAKVAKSAKMERRGSVNFFLSSWVPYRISHDWGFFMRKAGNEDFSLFMLDFWDEKPPPRLAPDS